MQLTCKPEIKTTNPNHTQRNNYLKTLITPGFQNFIIRTQTVQWGNFERIKFVDSNKCFC